MKKTFRKPHRIKPKKSIFRNRFFWLSFSILIILGAIFYLIYFSALFQIKNINIFGQEKVSPEQVKSFIETKTRTIFLVNFNEIREGLLKNFPQIGKINFKRKFPDTIEIKIEERKPVIGIVLGEKENESYFFIDENGIVFERIFKIPQETLKIKKLDLSSELKLGEKIMEEEEISKILEIKSKLADELKIPIEEILVVFNERFNVKTLEGWEIYFNPKENLNWQIIKLKAILEKKLPPEKRGKLQYIDLRFEKIYIFPSI